LHKQAAAPSRIGRSREKYLKIEKPPELKADVDRADSLMSVGGDPEMDRL
jgi:hypothetical protein